MKVCMQFVGVHWHTQNQAWRFAWRCLNAKCQGKIIPVIPKTGYTNTFAHLKSNTWMGPETIQRRVDKHKEDEWKMKVEHRAQPGLGLFYIEPSKRDNDYYHLLDLIISKNLPICICDDKKWHQSL